MGILTEEKKEANRVRGRKWRAARKDDPVYKKKKAEESKSRYHKSPAIRAAQQVNFKKSYHSDPKFRERVVRSASTGRYGMTPKQFDERLESQGGHCALCPSVDGDAGRRLHIDHDHACCTGKARTCGKCNRGILCGPCNRRLAPLENLLRESSVTPHPGTWTEKAMEYIEHYAWRHAEESPEVEALLAEVCDYFENQRAPALFGSVSPEEPPRTATGLAGLSSSTRYPGRLCRPTIATPETQEK